MKLTNDTALLASLAGSQVAKKIPRFEAIQNYIGKHVLPPIHFFPIIDKPVPINNVENDGNYELWKGTAPTSKDNQFFPFSFRAYDEENWFLLPWEPIINIEGGNIIAKRNIAKAGKNQVGSIKERWSTDDYQITITGAFYGDQMLGKPAQTYPRAEMEKLRNYLLSARAISVLCEPLQILNINSIVVESVSFPFTKGEDVQAYEIKALSDFPYNLIYKRKTAKIDVGMPIGGFEDKDY